MISAPALQVRLRQNLVMPVQLAGNTLLIDGLGVLIWPAHDLIIFSDLHFEKGSFLSQFANPLPRHDSTNTLSRMQQALAIYQCDNVISLGDSFHDKNALNRMQSKDLQSLNSIVDSVAQFIWVLGNHDPDIPEVVKGKRAAHIVKENVLLVHEPENLSLFGNETTLEAQIIGHFHPKCSHKVASRKITGKCFLKDEYMLLMPAFGRYTGGLDSKHEVFNELLSQQTMHTYLLHNNCVFHL